MVCHCVTCAGFVGDEARQTRQRQRQIEVGTEQMRVMAIDYIDR
jgi:hypothetical protein